MTKFQPDGWPTVIPRIFTEDVGGVIGFLKLLFGAHGQMRIGAPAEMRIGDSLIMVSDGGGVREARPSFLYVYVENTDETCQRALDAGALVIEEPAGTPYGDRRATVQDPWGNIWQIPTHAVRSPDGSSGVKSGRSSDQRKSG
jgi:uncharacterized glyoxalase superfamily protein PhnB